MGSWPYFVQLFTLCENTTYQADIKICIGFTVKAINGARTEYSSLKIAF